MCLRLLERSLASCWKFHKLFQLKMVLQTVSVRVVEVTGEDYPTIGQLRFCCKQVEQISFQLNSAGLILP